MILLLVCFDMLSLVHFNPHYNSDVSDVDPSYFWFFLLSAIMLFDRRHLFSPNYMVLISI